MTLTIGQKPERLRLLLPERGPLDWSLIEEAGGFAQPVSLVFQSGEVWEAVTAPDGGTVTWSIPEADVQAIKRATRVWLMYGEYVWAKGSV